MKAAALDVLAEEPPLADSPLFQFRNVVLTPHMGASTVEAMAGLSVECVRGIPATLWDAVPPNAIVRSTSSLDGA